MPHEGAWRTGVAQGREDEQERIINLLEAEYEQGGYEMGIVPHLIALIKGEK